jgi:hypothetical protein
MRIRMGGLPMNLGGCQSHGELSVRFFEFLKKPKLHKL